MEVSVFNPGAAIDLSSNNTYSLDVPFFDIDAHANLSELDSLINQTPAHAIANQAWPAYHTNCVATFRIIYTVTAFVIKYNVIGDVFNTQPRAINGDVHLDNCVEFFVQFNGQHAYYNIEFNCLGVGKAGYGATKQNRQLLPATTVSKIETLANLNKKPDGFDWQLLIVIPVDVFEFTQITLGSGLPCTGNFFKCGDHLPQPHFMSWTMLEGSSPNFHQPQFFGAINLK